LSVFELTPICFCLQSLNDDVMYDSLNSKFRTFPCCLRNTCFFFQDMYCIFIFVIILHVILQESTAKPPQCQSARPSFSCNDVILHVRVFPGLLSLIIAPGQKRDNTFRRAIMSPETVQKCYYL